MNEKRAIFIIDILKNIIEVYFDTFFVFYFFKVANYEVIPLAKYYFTLYLFCGLGFIFIRNAMKQNVKVHYFRIGIALQALYITLIMLLKEKIINYIFLVGLIRGVANGFYYFPKNILNTEKVSNVERHKFNGQLNIINKIVSIVVPLILGILLTYMSYTDLGKVFFILFIIMFVVSFALKDYKYYNRKFAYKKFLNLVKTQKSIRYSLFLPLLSGLTYSSGVMGIIITLLKIKVFKTNLNLGYVDSICAIVYLLTCIIYTHFLKEKQYKNISIISCIISFITLILICFFPSNLTLVLYLFVYNSFIGLTLIMTENTVFNLSNSEKLKEEFKPEYYCFREIALSISRCFGYFILLVVSLLLGIKWINYILLIPAVALLVEGFIVSYINSHNELIK